MSTCAIVPVRAGCDGKTRLAGVLSPASRAALVRSMLERVLDALRHARGVARIVIVTPDASLVPAGVEFVRDRGDGMNAAVTLALDHLGTGATAAVVVAADVPQVTSREIDRLVVALRTHEVVVVPDHLGTGTNALGLRLPAAIAPQFGPGSCAAHSRAARDAGRTLRVLALPGLARDVDVPADLDGCALPGLARDADAPAVVDGYALPTREQALALAERADLAGLMAQATALTLQGFGRRVSYSRKVFIPLTQLCRDVCHYCTFAGPPRRTCARLPVARTGARHRSRRRERRLPGGALYARRPARSPLRAGACRAGRARFRHDARLSRALRAARLRADRAPAPPERGQHDARRFRAAAPRLGVDGHDARDRVRRAWRQRAARITGHPTSSPTVRLATLRAAGEAGVPYTTGLLVGIGETRRERVESLLAIRDLHQRHGHIQELIVQNFRAKPGTRMARHPEPELAELQWTIAVARLRVRAVDVDPGAART